MTATIRARSTDTTGGSAQRERLGAAAVYAVGAVVYFIARQWLGLGFSTSPLFLGIVALVASAIRPRLLASGVLLTIWGASVLLDGTGIWREGRTDAVYIGAFGLGAAALIALRRWVLASVALESIAVVMVVVGLWYYFVHDYDTLAQPWLWSLVLLANAAALAGSAATRERQAGGRT